MGYAVDEAPPICKSRETLLVSEFLAKRNVSARRLASRRPLLLPFRRSRPVLEDESR